MIAFFLLDSWIQANEKKSAEDFRQSRAGRRLPLYEYINMRKVVCLKTQRYILLRTVIQKHSKQSISRILRRDKILNTYSRENVLSPYGAAVVLT